MTTCSTVAALGMMPLCLYLYTWSWNFTQNLTIPYQSIGLYGAWVRAERTMAIVQVTDNYQLLYVVFSIVQINPISF